MKHKTYIIKYTALDKSGDVLKEGTMKVKNKMSEFEAQCSFEDFLKNKYSNFGKLIVHNCITENPLSLLFGDSNPFGF